VEVLGRQRVVLLLDEAVDGLLDRERDPERLQLGAVGVEAPRERVLVHHAVSLDVAPDLRCGHRPTLGHQIGDQRELTDQFLGVLCHPRFDSRRVGPWGGPTVTKSARNLRAFARGCGLSRMADHDG
jgi:hypothetical protein